jgi:anti-anti-sigma regulatory factor
VEQDVLTIERHESRWLLKLEGQLTIAVAAEFRQMLLEWLASGKELELDLLGAEGVDIAILQLLWAVERDAASAGMKVRGRASAAALSSANAAGFSNMPGFPAS